MSAVVWLDGGLEPLASARVDPTDRGFTLGDGLYETIRARAGRPARLDAHLARLERGAALLGIPLPLDARALEQALVATLAANGLDDGALRVTLTRGPGARGLDPPNDPRPTLLVTASPLPPPSRPARVVVATSTRRNERSPVARVKALGALDALLARREARERGADDAILLGVGGQVAEATVANVFACVDGDLVTPRVEDGALPGVARAAILDTGAARESRLQHADLARSSEVFLSNALGLRAVVAVDGRPVGDGAEGPRLRALRALLSPA